MCTAISFKTKDHYFGRNLDLEYSYEESVTITPRNFSFHFRKEREFKKHYAMIGMALVVDDYPLYFDAANEKGLCMAGLNFLNNAVYHPENKEKINITPFELIPYILGICKNVSEVRCLLSEINIVNINFSEELPLSPLHWIISDRHSSITVESTKEGVKIYDNPYGVLTNNPPFDFHLHNLTQYLNLTREEPTVLILHTHATESYTQTEVYEESAAYRTLDDRFNMISLGKELARCLEAEGIMTIHDETSYDYPSYSGAYNRAREAVKTHLEENPSICLILDLHRDALEGEDGKQLGYTQQTPEGTAAKMMIVCGSDAGGLNYPNWQENLSLGLRFQGVLERNCPGLCRPLSFRTGRYNQDLMGNMLLVEVGAAGNTRQEALLAVRELARAIADMAQKYFLSETFLPELDRIYGGKTTPTAMGHPVHYMIQTDDTEIRREASKMLLQALCGS